MKHTRFAVIAAAAILLLVIVMVAGCGGGGAKTNSITSPYHGDLDGVETSPVDEDTDVPLDAWIRVYWPHDGYPPPREFTVTLQKEQSDSWGTVKTRLSTADSDPINGSWWFDPVSDFSPYTWYRIVIRATGEPTEYAYFLTGDWYEMSMTKSTKSASPAKTYRPAGAVDLSGEGSETHTITVTK